MKKEIQVLSELKNRLMERMKEGRNESELKLKEE
jgi:hypothetical protein